MTRSSKPKPGWRSLVFSGEGECWTWGQSEPIHRAFENVIRNAVKYTAEGTVVDVTVQPSAIRFRWWSLIAARAYRQGT